jgi:proteasome lid subunit RPN8/RPN11
MRVRRVVVNAIAAHAHRAFPQECCGLLVGDAHQTIEAVAVANVAEEPLRQYAVSPVEHLALIRQCRERSASGARLDVVGAYHSHPRSPAWPSAKDLEQACQHFLFIIAGPVGEAADVPIHGYRLQGTHFEEVRLVVDG